MERLFLQFPRLSRQQLESHDSVIEKIHWNKKHKKSILEDWKRQRKVLRGSADSLFERELETATEYMSKQLEFVKQEQRNRRIQGDISVKLPQYMDSLEGRRKQEEENRNRLVSEQLKHNEARELYLHGAKAKTEEFKEQKTQKSTLKALHQLQTTSQSKAALQQTIQQNKNKVQHRQNKHSGKLRELALSKEQTKNKQLVTQLRIECAVAKYPHVPTVGLDRARAQQPTQSLIAKLQPQDKAPLPLTGFTAENLMRDMRYRLSSLLSQAGLAHSEYGHRMVQVASSHKDPRKDTFSTLKFS